MYTGQLVFAEVMEHRCTPFPGVCNAMAAIPRASPSRAWTKHLWMAFAQLTHRESLRDIEVCLCAQDNKPCHMGIRGGISRNTLANANKVRNWRIYGDFAQPLMQIDVD
jgi:hypothetical protein